METHASIETLQSWDTGYSADSVEWCPVELHHYVFICGTYQLFKEEDNSAEGSDDKTTKSAQKRLGKIYLFVVDDLTRALEPTQTIETSAVLDQKWCRHTINQVPYVGVVNAAGFVEIYKLLKDIKYKLEFVTKLKINEEDNVLALSLDWSTGKHDSQEPQIVVSDSIGNITVCVLQSDEIIKLHQWNAHSYEAWICSFDYWNPTIVFTGGDDCSFKVFDLRCGTDSILLNRSHEAGVTSLHSNFEREFLLTSGSYDEKVRLWDTRKLRRPTCEQELGGGIWRLKWDPLTHGVLLAACMYGGFRVVDCRDSSANIIAEYHEHKSIAYGADWCHKVESQNLIATCSFYDCKLNLAKIKY